METRTLIKLQALIENYGQGQPLMLDTVLSKFQTEIIMMEQIDSAAVEEIRDAMYLTEIFQISAALGLEAALAIDALKDLHHGVQADYLSEMSNLIKGLVHGKES